MPTVVAVSLVPDVVVGATGSLTGSTWGGVIALMGMHLAVAVCGIASFRIFLPLIPRPEPVELSGASHSGVEREL